MAHRKNPFGLTKATDLSDLEILDLWVDVTKAAEISSPATPMPTYVLGGKGSGKTHLMRYHSLAVQALRARSAEQSVIEVVTSDGYVGIYGRFGGLNAKRFSGKGIAAEKWEAVFAYYVELWVVREAIRQLDQHDLLSGGAGNEKEFCCRVAGLFDRWPNTVPETVLALDEALTGILRTIDYETNNSIWSERFNPEILSTRGALLFGIPYLLKANYPWANGCTILYSLDEIEHLTKDQQVLINTFVAEKRPPATFRIGCRTFGIKTRETLGDRERLVEGSEFHAIRLDEELRNSKKYPQFASRMVATRLEKAGLWPPGLRKDKESLRFIESCFEQYEASWDSEYFETLVTRFAPPLDRPYFRKISDALAVVNPDDDAKSAEGRVIGGDVISRLAAAHYPLLEKLNCMLFYRAMKSGHDLDFATNKIEADCSAFINGGGRKSRYYQALSHFHADLSAQLHREVGEDVPYVGWKTFVGMSEGLPRSLLVILRNIYDWSLFYGEGPFTNCAISKRSQKLGVAEAATWFFESMRQAGELGTAIETITERLAELLRANRFADTPAECSALTFAVPLKECSQGVADLVERARDRSFLIQIRRGHRDKNTGRIFDRFEINRMLAPKWDLPTGSRGTLTLSTTDADVLFSWRDNTAWKRVVRQFERTHNLPFRSRDIEHAGLDAAGQPDLFGTKKP